MSRLQLLILILLLGRLTCFSINIDSLLREASMNLYEKQNYIEAYKDYNYFFENVTDHPNYYYSLYEYGTTLYHLEKFDEAITAYNQILSSDCCYNFEMDKRGILKNPNARLVNMSYSKLADIHISIMDYAKALSYIVIADSTYPFIHFCGNAYAANDIKLAVQYSRCYYNLNETNKAIEVLLPHIFNNGLASNKEAVQYFQEVISKKYSKDQFCEELENAIATIIVKSDKEAYITIFNKQIQMTPIDFHTFRVKNNHPEYKSWDDLEFIIHYEFNVSDSVKMVDYLDSYKNEYQKSYIYNIEF